VPTLRELQQRARAQLDALPPGCKRIREPERYPVEVTTRLLELTHELQSR
jgi:hypothetical protein